ncbi:hypothetical protein FR483_n179R [Paramecium bursaria Chlorella virus FR483]|uniref:Uncharacterized protein n179R n=1 Tax=Paramecium bursaria Chlorella virus FR483 TaxID=399781 RepID=A7J6N3_PBCVF|nr:hypothetical protein FR483_n179R [Paramecium bursaria Chlorella virus FR483]ABT15464.1 hypothetical protein FR483_n179R [Paramecium bursaria Chlorella virus FR483]
MLLHGNEDIMSIEIDVLNYYLDHGLAININQWFWKLISHIGKARPQARHGDYHINFLGISSIVDVCDVVHDAFQ